MATSGINVVHAGSATRDLTPDDPRGWRLGGGVSYAALTTARLGLKTGAVVGVDPQAAAAFELDLLRDAGVELALVQLGQGPVFRNLETAEGRVQVCMSIGEPVPVPRLPISWARAAAWSMVPVAGEIDDAWIASIPRHAFLAVGWQGWLRTLVPGRPIARREPSPSELLRRADLVGVSRPDLGSDRAPDRLTRLLRPGAALLVTDGAAGGRLITVGEESPAEVQRYTAHPPARTIDPTGAGDVFLAALSAVTIEPEIVGRRRPQRGWDLQFAAAVASLVVEAPGLLGVPELDAVLARLRD